MNYLLFLSYFFILPMPVQAALFGADNREIIDSSHPKHQLSRSTAVGILSSLYEESPSGESSLKIYADPLDGFICQEENFSDQLSLPYACSGFLVAPSLIATAGHCMVNTGSTRYEYEMFCDAYAWLFDYDGNIDPKNIPKENLYECKQIIYAINDEQYPYSDYALIELDRPVENRTPLPLSPSLTEGEEVFMIGHPLGIPSTLSHDAQVLYNNPQRESFITNLDAFSGNSGSAVFNLDNQVIGILIAGTPLPELFKDGKCHRYNRCDYDGKNCLIPDPRADEFPGYQLLGTEIQRIDPIIEMLENYYKSL